MNYAIKCNPDSSFLAVNSGVWPEKLFFYSLHVQENLFTFTPSHSEPLNISPIFRFFLVAAK